MISLTWVRGLGTSIIQLSNFNYLLVSTLDSDSGSTYSDEKFGLLVQRIQQGCKLLAVYIPRAKNLGRHCAFSMEKKKKSQNIGLFFGLERGSWNED